MKSPCRQRFWIFVLFVGLANLAMMGCTDSEVAARKMHNEAMTAEREGRQDDAIAIYQKIVDQYPETRTSIEANKQLIKLARVDSFTAAYDKKTWELRKEDLLATLDLYRLETGQYPTEKQALSALLTDPGNVPNWHGPYLKAAAVTILPHFSYRLNSNGLPELILRTKPK